MQCLCKYSTDKPNKIRFSQFLYPRQELVHQYKNEEWKYQNSVINISCMPIIECKSLLYFFDFGQKINK